MVETIPVLRADYAIRELHGASVFIDIAHAHDEIRIRAVAGHVQLRQHIAGDGQRLRQHRCREAQHIGPLLFVGIVLRHLELILRHIDDMHGRMVRIINIVLRAARLRKRIAQHTAAACLPGSVRPALLSEANVSAVQIEHFPFARFHRPAFRGLPLVLADRVILDGRCLLDAVVDALQEMLQPLHAEDIHIIAERVVAQAERMQIVLRIAAVLPRTEHGLPCALLPGLDEVERLGRAHAVIVEPAGHDKRRNLAALVALRPVASFPECIHIRMLEPLFEERDFMSQRLLRNLVQRTDIEDLIPVVLRHKIRAQASFRHHERPGQHTGVEAAATTRDVNEGTSGTDTAQHRLEMRVATGGRGPLYIAEIGSARHAHLSIAERLCCDPVQGIVAIFDFVVLRHPFTGTVLASPGILYDDRIASLQEAVVLILVFSLAIRCADQNRREAGFLRAGRQIDVRRQLLAISGRNQEGAGGFYAINRTRLILAVLFCASRINVLPVAEHGFPLPALLYEHGRHIAGAHDDAVDAFLIIEQILRELDAALDIGILPTARERFALRRGQCLRPVRDLLLVSFFSAEKIEKTSTAQLRKRLIIFYGKWTPWRPLSGFDISFLQCQCLFIFSDLSI